MTRVPFKGCKSRAKVASTATGVDAVSIRFGGDAWPSAAGKPSAVTRASVLGRAGRKGSMVNQPCRLEVNQVARKLQITRQAGRIEVEVRQRLVELPQNLEQEVGK